MYNFGNGVKAVTYFVDVVLIDDFVELRVEIVE